MDAVCARSRRGLRVLLSLPVPHFQAALQGGRRAAPVVHSETREGLRDWPGACHGQQLNLSPFCRKGAGCYCKISAELEPTAVCPCRRGECGSMRTGTEMCHRVQPAQGWCGTRWRIWPSSGSGVDVGQLEMAQREHKEG